ncbi:hypothetical protein PMZ73_16985 [[Clostridium] symbiosum]|uniref:Uncharacterized protein n=1 Tax=Clostridium symbiosum TaxID=1512 RepID=A0AAW6AWF1_CLOSY|nr:hypothetical protein [[Clostridium] symbiosum]MDB1979284.1 hypothetical protein [[Clostridium] symbiosum]MDB1983838.1 hypothetical protein [[Clostridium] symbiosum]MDB1985496.1 hypothetical protein [[Clostridium] symbiosum]MDB1990131.1 hypothetical protein [[Clostridium] symbiosum]MDB1994642.1 hypothetical protein [[Clostridium] symbiosum]
MQACSQAYKAEMKKEYRNHSYMRVTIGLINQEAQSSAFVPNPTSYAYYSNLKWPLDNYSVSELYTTCDEDYNTVDGSMYFLPRRRQDVVLNAGIVTEGLLGSILIHFPIQYNIKGLTVEFGKAYPVDFTIESDNNTVEIAGNASGHFVTEEIFTAATFLRFTPSVMVNGQSRFRIHQLTMGIGIYFDNKKIKSASKKEHISPISEELPTIDFDLTVENKDRAYDVENRESTVNFLEPGQEISVLYGQELDDGTVEWLPGATVSLKEWSADDEEMSFSASDRFDGMNATYYKGLYRESGISLYDLATDVFDDAGVDYRTYWLDPYLKDVLVKNPMPVVTHKEALQIIANAGRCILYQDRSGDIYLKSSFIPDMTASSDNETYFSHAGAVLNGAVKADYAMPVRNYSDARPTQFFLPRQAEGTAYLDTGYISEETADENGLFSENPTITIVLEAAFKCFGLTMEFGRNHPEQMIFHAYYNGELQESYSVTALEAISLISHEFPDFDRLVLEFTRGCPNNRIVLDNISFGDSTDYVLEYGHELTKTPKGTQVEKTRELQVLRTLYNSDAEVKELAKETITFTAADNQYTFYFSNPSYGFTCAITGPADGQSAAIVESSSYYVTVEVAGAEGELEIVVNGHEYAVSQAKVSRQMNPTGKLETWENPLVSEVKHAVDLADWIGDYMKADREYALTYRGEPRIDANDIVFLENRYVADLLLRIYDHTLNFNGALSGSMKARRDMSNVATAKNRLAGK